MTRVQFKHHLITIILTSLSGDVCWKAFRSPVVHERMRKPPEDHLPGAFFCAVDNGSDRFKEE